MAKTTQAVLKTLFLIAFTLTACSPVELNPTQAHPVNTVVPLPNTPTAVPAPMDTLSPLAAYYIPPYYPSFYVNTIEASKKEDGLIIYSIMSPENWEPVIGVFNEHYPWIKVTTVELKTTEVFTHYDDESAAGTRSADIVISSDPIGWQEFISANNVQTYSSQEDLLLPQWSKLAAGLYTLSADPVLIIYNKKLVQNPPDSMASLVKLANNGSADYLFRIIIQDAEENATAFDINWFWIKTFGEDGWQQLQVIGRNLPKLTPDPNEIVSSVASGNAKLSYFISADAVFPVLDQYPDLGWSYIHDGQPVSLRSMAMTTKAQSPNSAKLMMDFLLSQEGQLALDKGGLTPYREDIADIASHHLEAISTAVGEGKLIFISLDSALRDEAQSQAFLERWKAAVHKRATP